jgi:cytochrome c oxidase subunit IV
MEMMAVQDVGQGRKTITKKSALLMLAGGAAGGALGAGVMTLAKHMHVATKSLTWADLLAYWLGVTFLGVGLFLYGNTFNRKFLAQNIEGESASLPATDQEVYAYRLQAATLILAGVMVLLPLLAMGTLSETRARQWLVFAGVALLFVLQTIANVMVWRGCDEFLRGQMLLTSAITFAIGQGALFLWAAAERLHLVRSITSWDTIILLLALYLATGTVIGVRNRPRC